jgi:DNA helicase-2/ATP-dependent DNA helicase PcrA
MTRASEALFLTAADYYGEGKREKRLSPFVFEALGEDVLASERSPRKAHKQLTFLDYKPVTEPLTISHRPLAIHIDYLSYSQIETFKTCPLHYKLRYIYKVPTPPSAAQSFGSSIHAAIRDFYLAVKTGARPTEKLILDFLEKNWIKEGFAGKTHERKFFEKGKLYLRGFLKQGFSRKKLPIVMEEPFTIPLIDKKGRRLRIGGKIDRVDVLPDGTIEIIDYKTGATIPLQKEVDNNLQLSFYALAATNIPNKPFGKKTEQVKLSLYFLDQQEKISTTRNSEQLQKATEEIFGVKKEIENSDFTCSGGYFCQNKCEYSLFCGTQD